MKVDVRIATREDLPAILSIYNQGIEDRITRLEQDPKDMAYIDTWFSQHNRRYPVFVATVGSNVVGWADLHPYSHRFAYADVGELSVYVERAWRGKGVGQALLRNLEIYAVEHGFHKLVLATFPFNQAGQGLYRKMGFREVGVFRRHGKLGGKWVDVMWMEKPLV
ncbi:arsinothricin resistance N-acetyltransferase ArsN1 family A [Alicyclobacillus acidocaldarius]|uniref:GCN5-related N-acetyltransferase n=1 Tax=Alicyclobacillus acidocaldarius subsp. acidocaldarius (strain ATCC 27009 / DSM 446 / BCRC 14685 / JCM 5260 / KCTC 1825 / NBRC 15652 / NCIMB 11725 / NRRL B-14509 / 104-IA) TaxID=521098 RepID=C8WST3_ALIAD|nr:arsinothricin resistance N-acetyltransferase ArsN1 family A [Alicyclobacillus acidocaldarius]ACV57589.1 GCN5-related N-acetyltransferase [Alicyclobacillus acidocaldarius subsp. acidocaldarius DSM 446]